MKPKIVIVFISIGSFWVGYLLTDFILYKIEESSESYTKLVNCYNEKIELTEKNNKDIIAEKEKCAKVLKENDDIWKDEFSQCIKTLKTCTDFVEQLKISQTKENTK